MFVILADSQRGRMISDGEGSASGSGSAGICRDGWTASACRHKLYWQLRKDQTLLMVSTAVGSSNRSTPGNRSNERHKLVSRMIDRMQRQIKTGVTCCL